VKFLLDAHLPPVLGRVMAREGYEVTHVAQLEMKGATDPDIWQYAKSHGYVVISKDEDFMRYRRDTDANPRFIWVRTGNCKNRELIETLIKHLPAVIEFLDSGNAMVEIFRQS